MRNSTLWLMVKTLPAKDTIEVSQDESVSIRCSALHLFAPIDKRPKSLAFHAGVAGSNPARSTNSKITVALILLLRKYYKWVRHINAHLILLVSKEKDLYMAPRVKWSSRQPVTLKIAGSIPAGVASSAS